jgi:hypothetical protein
MKFAAADAITKAREYTKLQKIIENSGYLNKEHERDCRIMNRYKQLYEGKIPFKFRPKYNWDLKYNIVKQEREECEFVIRSYTLPGLLKKAALGLSAIIEWGSTVFMGPWLGYDLEGFSEDIETAVMGKPESGIEPQCDEEFELLAIKYADWLSRSPEERLLFKLGHVMIMRAMINRKHAPVINNPTFVNRKKDL